MHGLIATRAHYQQDLFKGSYDGVWVLNDHSLFNFVNPSYAFQDNELYLTKSPSLTMMKYLKLLDKGCVKPFSSFHVTQFGETEIQMCITEASSAWIKDAMSAVKFLMFVAVLAFAVIGLISLDDL